MGFAKTARRASYAAEATARFTIWPYSTDGRQCVLIVRPAAQPNDAYINAAFKLPSSSRPGAAQMSVSRIKETAAEYAPLFARHIIVGWEHVYEDEAPDAVAPFTADKALEFLLALIKPPPDGRPDVFVDLRVFCGQVENFRAPIVDAVDLGKG
jgi:hypothetical protein